MRCRDAIDRVVVHRIEVSQEDRSFGDTPREITRFFAQHEIGRRATGGKMPYALLIDSEGTLTQTVPLTRVTPHVRAYNPSALGIGCIGDFRSHPPAPAQWAMLQLVCVDLLRSLGLSVDSLVGHDELAGASIDPQKRCPGDALALDELRECVQLAMSSARDASIEWVW